MLNSEEGASLINDNLASLAQSSENVESPSSLQPSQVIYTQVDKRRTITKIQGREKSPTPGVASNA